MLWWVLWHLRSIRVLQSEDLEIEDWATNPAETKTVEQVDKMEN